MVHPVKFVVEHVEDGTEQGSISWFHNPSAQVSAHFLIAKDGTLHQAVDTDDAAWAEASFNPVAWSVETEGTPDEPLTDQQIGSFARLIAWLESLDHFPLVVTDDPHSAGGLITHGDLGAIGGGHAHCPGDLRKAQRPEIIQRALALSNPSSPSPEDDDMYDFARTIRWPDGSITYATTEGNIENYGNPPSPYFGGVPQLLPQDRQGFTQCNALCPVNPQDKTAGYIVCSASNATYTFNAQTWADIQAHKI